MFTGIVQGQALIKAISGSDKLKTFRLQFPLDALKNIQRGASVAINGTCLTVTKFDLERQEALFDVMAETLNKTNLAGLSTGDKVNFERAARVGDEIGGHIMSGHIHSIVKVENIAKDKDNCTITFSTPRELHRYLLPKGFVGLNGCSLTLGEVNEISFSVHLIPETLAVTNFSELVKGSVVNLEIDNQTQAIVDTVERVLQQRA